MTRSTSSDFHRYLIYLNVALYATCFQIQRPLEPFLVSRLQGNDLEYARLQSFFSVAQTIGSLAAGRLLDVFGIKGGFLISFLSSALCYAILSRADSLSMLYLSKVPTIFQAGFLCAQAAIAQLTDDGPQRTKSLGMLTMSYTVGSIIGPSLGGILGASGDYYLGARIAVVGSLISVVLVLLGMPSSLVDKPASDRKKHVDACTEAKADSEKNESFPGYYALIQQVWVLLATKVISSMANAMNSAILPLVLKNQFQFTEAQMGYTLSTASTLNALVNGLLLGNIIDACYGDLRRLIEYCMAALAVTCILTALCTQSAAEQFLSMQQIIALSLTCMFLYNIFQYVLGTVITGESTSLVNNATKGSLLGLEHSLFALARIGSPQVGVYLLQAYGVPGVSLVSCAIFLTGFQLFRQFIDSQSTHPAERKEK